jgi:hypothetical protein
MENDNIESMDRLSEDALAVAILWMYLPAERQEEILQRMKAGQYE